MPGTRLDNTLKAHRDRLGLSQQALADIVGVSRQAVIAIEGGRQVPSTSLGLRLARALRCGVEDLFRLSKEEGLSARLAPSGPDDEGQAGRPEGTRVAVGEVEGRWVAHRLPVDPTTAADGIVARGISGRTAVVRPLADPELLRLNVLVAGCAPLLGALVARVGRRHADARATWLPASSGRALDLLREGLVHVAGVHFTGTAHEGDNVEVVRRMFPGRRMLVVNLTRWRQGLVVPSGNPLALRSGAALLRPGLKLARREKGAAAHRLLTDLLASEGVASPSTRGPLAAGHEEVAKLVRCGAADAGIAIESVALAEGLGFVPLTEERFDLVVPADAATVGPVARLLETVDDPDFRADSAQIPGYDCEIAGHVTTLEAA